MSSCKLVNTAEIEPISELVRKNLYRWCLDDLDKNDRDLGINCEDLAKSQSDNTCFTEIFTEEIENLNEEDLKKKIIEKKKTLIQLQNFSEEINDYTDERDLNLLQNINKNKFQELIILVLLLIFAWCFGIYLIFNYLVIEK